MPDQGGLRKNFRGSQILSHRR